MEHVIHAALRNFVGQAHIKNLLRGDWVSLFDENGSELKGIRGRVGVSAPGLDGSAIGIDLMEMQPGSAFPRHVHSGDHVLYILSGEGIAEVNGQEHRLVEGDSIFVAAEQPHAFKAPESNSGPLILLAIGHPHKLLSSLDRMRLISESEEYKD
jgi:quercetin dioxygenase-like cupin family protein